MSQEKEFEMGKEMRRELDRAVNQVGAALSALRADVDGVDARLREVRGQIEALENAPVSLDDWGGFLRAYIAKKGERFVSPLLPTRLLAPSGYGERPEPFNKRPWADFERGDNVLPGDMVKMLSSGDYSAPLLCALFPDQVCALILSNVKKHLGDKWGNEDAVPVSERRVLAAVLVRERDDLLARREELKAEIDRLVGQVS
ncbi:MAG: hypothetical protein QMB75_00215 [Thauera sp.]|uniref:Uncharacterized protein n=1 Tax=Thauera phenylacetica B4P TaxID=1234382 RepID=N6YTE8_9RHOO|nr:hypothetical protein [Thauera phenylacetica]ENO97556.1 hypothetical protein C667_08133 [Thauera phenylacetica B4P]